MAAVYGYLAQWTETKDEKQPELNPRQVQELGEYCVNKGKELLTALDSRIVARDEEEFAAWYQETFDRGYDLDVKAWDKFAYPDAKNPGDRQRALKDARDNGLDPSSFRVKRAISKVYVEQQKYTSETATNARAGILIATNLIKANDASGWKSLHPSDLLFIQWKRSVDEEEHPSSLKCIWQYCITNPVTKAVIEECLGAKRGRKISSTFGKNSEQLAMLCRTPNGKGVVRMLTDHAHALGFKGVASVEVIWSKHYYTWHLCFRLVDPPGKKKR